MFTIKHGLPDPDEIVICTVKMIQPHAVTVFLDEYKKQGLIHISEISPGRIRNIHDFVKEGKVVVCKVLNVNRELGHIDLSLRRVTDMLRKNKVAQVKQEQKAEKILEYVAKNRDKKAEELYEMIKDKVFKDYDSLYSCFESVVEDKLSLLGMGIEPSLAKELEEAINQRIKPVEVKVGGNLSISTYSFNGVEGIKKALLDVKKLHSDIIIRYHGAGKYWLEIRHSNFKDAEFLLSSVVENVKASFKKDNTAVVGFERKEIKD